MEDQYVHMVARTMKDQRQTWETGHDFYVKGRRIEMADALR